MTALLVSAILFSAGVFCAGVGLLLDVANVVYRDWKFDR